VSSRHPFRRRGARQQQRGSTHRGEGSPWLLLTSRSPASRNPHSRGSNRPSCSVCRGPAQSNRSGVPCERPGGAGGFLRKCGPAGSPGRGGGGAAPRDKERHSPFVRLGGTERRRLLGSPSPLSVPVAPRGWRAWRIFRSRAMSASSACSRHVDMRGTRSDVRSCSFSWPCADLRPRTRCPRTLSGAVRAPAR
jgi:hypothetical protein